jgi:hypothetical protein
MDKDKMARVFDDNKLDYEEFLSVLMNNASALNGGDMIFRVNSKYLTSITLYFNLYKIFSMVSSGTDARILSRFPTVTDTYRTTIVNG